MSARPLPQPDDDPIAEAFARAKLRERRGRAMRPPPPTVSALTRRKLKTLLEGAGPAIGALEADWAKIVGDKLASVTRPGKVTSGPRGRTLVLHVLPAAAVIVEHQADALRKRISLAAGGDIVRIKISQGLPSASPKKRPIAPRREPRPLSAEEMARLQAAAQVFVSPALRARIVALGEAMLSEEG